MWGLVTMCSVVVVVVVAVAEGTSVNASTGAQEESHDTTRIPTDRQAWKKCLQKLTPACAKLLVSRLADLLPRASLQIAPGITLQANSSQSLELADFLAGLLANPLSAHYQLVPKVRHLLETVTVSVQLEDPSLLRQVKTLSEEVVDGLVNTGESEGRKKGYGGALLWSAGALAAVGFAALAAVAGKAMMASMMALMLAGMTTLRGLGGGGGGDGGGHKYSNVEIIKAPAHFELAPAPHYEGGHAFEHDHYYTAPAGAYDYGRMMTVARNRGDKTASTQ